MSERELNPDAIGKAETSVAAAPPVARDETALGYGHRAHSPDPNASYGFDPGKPRTLPRDKKRRWKVPG